VLDPDRPATPLERQTLRALVARALAHEPVHYLVGEKWFYGLPIHVDRRVLIPRPATETIVDTVLRHVKAQPGFGGPKGEGVVLADVCTGSGCIAVAILKYLPGARAIATDISPDALEVARQNAARHSVADRIEFLLGDLLTPLQNHPAAGRQAGLNYLVSNPPYIPDHEWAAVAPNVKNHEPEQALRGGADGLTYVRPVLAGAAELLRPGGLALVEIADSTAEAARELASQVPGLETPEILTDIEGYPRVIMARRPDLRSA
jgi:release factor glutamine methyltransferase